MLYVDASPRRGRGIFTDAPIPEGAVIERCPVIEIPAAQRGAIDGTVLFDYYFGWGEDGGPVALALGFGSLYNHSSTPNARFVRKPGKGLIEFVALREITAGEEVLIDYAHGAGREGLWDPERIDWRD